jgi:hypothetical protein
VLAFALPLLLVVACETAEPPPAAPVVEGLSVNGVELRDGYGPIIVVPMTLELRTEVRSSRALAEVRLLLERHGDEATVLQRCTTAVCRVSWRVTVADNGVYSFAVEAEDVRGASVRLPFRNALAIAIAE